MNTQKQIAVMIALVFVLLGGCAAYTVYDQPREESAQRSQDAIHAERGARIFARYCRQCHGNAGEGRIGPALNTLSDPAERTKRNLTVNDITDTISCGRVGKIMPAWAIAQGGALTNEQISDLVTLITTNAGDGWKKAGEFSAEENAVAPVPSVEDVIKAGAITGAAKRSCGQLAPATETPAAEAGTVPAGLKATDKWTETATDNKFDVAAMAVTVGTASTVTLDNKGAALHNWEVLDDSGKVLKDDSGKDISVQPLVEGGKSGSVTFTVSKPGVYNYRCQVHPTEMTGKLYVLAADGTLGAAAGTPAAGNAAGAAPAGGGTPNNTVAETMTDNKFSQTAITVASGKPVQLTADNKGSALHNFHVLNVKDDKGADIKTDFIDGGKSATLTFTISKPGSYDFQCDVHPADMKGKLVVQ